MKPKRKQWAIAQKLDSDLGGGLRGEKIAAELHAQGFSNLYLATGHPPEALPSMPWIKKIVGKEAPWSWFFGNAGAGGAPSLDKSIIRGLHWRHLAVGRGAAMNPKTRWMLLVALAMTAGGIVFAQDGQSDIQRRIMEARQKSIREMAERRQQQGAQAFAPREVAGPGAAGPATQAAVDPCEKSRAVVESWRKRYVDENLQRMANQLDSAVKSAARYGELVRRPPPDGDEASSASMSEDARSSLKAARTELFHARKLLNYPVETLRNDREIRDGMRLEAQSQKIDPETWGQCSRSVEVQGYPPKVLAALEPDQRKLLPKIEANLQAVGEAYEKTYDKGPLRPLEWVSLETRGEMLSYVEP